MAFVSFMESTAGRAVRITAGLALIAVGAWLGGAWWVLAAAGLIPLGAGLAGICLAAPLFHAPLRAAHRA
jgi:Inner membrane protein YgaP-like, transmembrane domain